METVLVTAYAEMLKTHPNDCSVDRILEDPVFRGEFLGRVRGTAADRSEFDILRTLHNLRKRSKLPRRNEDEPSKP